MKSSVTQKYQTRRRQRALERLQKQLQTNTKRNKEGILVPLTEHDIERIAYDIEVLKERIGGGYE